MKLLEVCVDSLASARAAKQGGADRLEFCSALAVGGLTPYADLLRQIKAELDLPVRCLMRPRAGDFLYTRDELELLCRQIGTLRSAGADGFVIGALTPEGALDLPAMRTLLDACGGAPVTLHRCIDVSRDLCATYRAAAALGIDTVLTSGGAGSCRKGISQLAALLRLRDELDGPEVLIGAGVNAAVIDELRAALPGARAFHARKRYDLPPRGCPHGPARVGRMAYPADRRRRRVCCQGRRNAVSAGRQNLCPASLHNSKTKVPAVF